MSACKWAVGPALAGLMALASLPGLAAEATTDPRALAEQAQQLVEQGHPEQAEPLYRRAATLLEEALGPDHPQVIEVLRALAEFYGGEGRPDEAEPLYKRIVANQ